MRLSEYTTLRLGGTAEKVYQPQSEIELSAKVAELDQLGEPFFVLGGGSNLVIADAPYLGTVIWFGPEVGPEFHRIERVAVTGAAADTASVCLEVGAAVVWDKLVAYTVSQGFAGLECLSGIPGLVGATPMQNVGAYGQEVQGSIESVRAYDRTLGEVVTLTREACAFAYRSSCFRGEVRWVLLSVRFRLQSCAESMAVTYSELAKALQIPLGARAPLQQVRDTVIGLRKTKGMVVDANDSESVSAGSFFTNPVLDSNALAALCLRCAALGLAAPPQFPVLSVLPSLSMRAASSPEKVKVAAAWLIEQAGFSKGYTLGRVRLSRKHALALVNSGGTTRELCALAQAIRAGVLQAFGVLLETEPVFLGVSLELEPSA